MRKREKVRLGRCLIVILDFIRIVVLKFVHHPWSSTSSTFKITLLHVVGTISFPASVSSLYPLCFFHCISAIYVFGHSFVLLIASTSKLYLFLLSNILVRHRLRHPFLSLLVKLVFLLELWKTSINQCSSFFERWFC